MAVIEHVTRVFGGHAEDGTPIYETTRHGRPRTPESVAEWAEQRVAALSYMGQSTPAGRVVVALLEAGEDGAAVKAAVAAGRDLDDWQRRAVRLTLQVCRTKASEGYSRALGFMDGLLAAWVGKWGDREPRPPRLPAPAARVIRLDPGAV